MQRRQRNVSDANQMKIRPGISSAKALFRILEERVYQSTISANGCVIVPAA